MSPDDVYVDSRLRRASAYSWRFLVVAALAGAFLWLVGQLLIVVIPMAVAVLVTRALAPVTSAMQRRGIPRGIAAFISIAAVVIAVGALLAGVGAAVAAEFDDLAVTVGQGIDEVEQWLVQDAPFDVDRDEVEQVRERLADRAGSIVSSGGTMTGSAVLLAEFVSGMLLAVIVSFFLLKDFDEICDAAVATAPSRHRQRVRLLGRRAWSTLGAYLRGVAVLGTVEALIIGVTVWLVGGELVAAVAALTLLGAFVPIIGAIVAGAVAVLVTLATTGLSAAAIVLVVAIVVQQLDNDLLAPVIYGKSFNLHPLVILLSVAAGTALFGIIGAVFAVPTTAVALNLAAEWRSFEGEMPSSGVRVTDEPGPA